jgi:hypothetical protein
LSRASLIDAYVSALPFVQLAIVAVPSGRCRIETGGTSAPAFYFKASHLDLLLGAAGLPEGRTVDQSPAAVAALIRRTTADMGAPFETAAEIRAAAEREVDKILARVEATNQAGGLTLINKLPGLPLGGDRPGRKGAAISRIHRAALHGRDRATGRGKRAGDLSAPQYMGRTPCAARKRRDCPGTDIGSTLGSLGQAVHQY